VTNVATGRQLAGAACLRSGSTDRPATLRLVKPRHSNLDCRSWRLAPTNDGTWTLTTSGATETVRLLNP
jgi:hypothetical protein